MKFLFAFWLAAASAMAHAACTYHTYTDSSGRYTTCTTCCYGNQCNTTCY